MMRQAGTCKTVTVLVGVAVLAVLISAGLALIDEQLSGRAWALFAVGFGFGLIGLAANSRRAERNLATAVASAPRNEYYRGYGCGAEDALNTAPLDSVNGATDDLSRS
ncbi:hypothetical protein [Micromonospora zhanjiangensis]|uniref:Uncharacterized protein n=1 Tax=Micromonospora zhanjiangensis TaxID=1522057 RepID=A0ABV8KP92_9ACTN